MRHVRVFANDCILQGPPPARRGSPGISWVFAPHFGSVTPKVYRALWQSVGADRMSRFCAAMVPFVVRPAARARVAGVAALGACWVHLG